MYCCPPQILRITSCNPKKIAYPQVIAKQSFAFYKSTTRQDRQKQFTVCFQLLSAFVLYMSVSYSKKKSSKSQFRVLQKEILTYSNSNSRSMDAVGSNPKPGCPSMDRNWLWIRTMSRVCGKRWLDEY